MKYQLLFAGIILSIAAIAQDTVNLQNCIALALSKNAIADNAEQYKAITALEQKKADNSRRYPSLTLKAQYSYQSETTTIDLGELPQGMSLEFPELSAHHYGATVEIKQNIYDGGVGRTQKELSKVNCDANTAQLDIDLDAVKSQVSKLYFSILLLKKQETILALYKETLETQHRRIQTAVDNGASLASNLYMIEAELLGIEQQQEATKVQKQALTNSLSTLIKKDIDTLNFDDSAAYNSIEKSAIARPELQLMDIQQTKINVSKDMLSAARKPKVYAFATGGYGTPGLDMFKEGIHPYYMAGVGISWSIYDRNETKHSRSILDAQKTIIANKKEQFSESISIAQDGIEAEIKKIKAQLDADEKIIALRKKISKTLEVQFNNGTITSSEYITELSKERDALLQKEVHTLQLQNAVVNYMLTNGSL